VFNTEVHVQLAAASWAGVLLAGGHGHARQEQDVEGDEENSITTQLLIQ
jgi:hypothetical protein